MKQILSYNIHNILKFQIIRDATCGWRDRINLKFSYFEVDKVEDPDITLNIGKFTPSCTSCYSVDHKYYIKQNYLYSKESEGVAEWELQINGLEDGPTILHYDGKIRGISSLLNRDFLAQNFLLKIIEYKLYQKGYYLAHAGGVSKDGKGYILAGRGGSFKTTLCMDLIRKKGCNLLGDDRILIGNGSAYSFPMSLSVFSYMLQNLDHENAWGFSHKLDLLRQLSNNSLSVDTNVCEHKPVNISGLSFISRVNISEPRMQQVSGEDTFQKLIMNNRLEDYIDISFLRITSGPFLRYMLAYSYIFPDSKFARFLDRSGVNHPEIVQCLGGLAVSNMMIPKIYNEQVVEQLCDIIGLHGIGIE